MKKSVLLLFAILFSHFALAERFTWVNHSEQTYSYSSSAICVDAAGNSYSLIWTDHTGATIDGNSFPCSEPNAYGILVVKYDNNGSFIWARMINTDAGVIYGEKIAADADGNVYVSIQLPNGGNTHLPDTTFFDSKTAQIIKFDSSGNFIRQRSFTGNAAPRISCLGYDLYVSQANSIYKLDSALSTVWSISDPSYSISFDGSGFGRTDIFAQDNGEVICSVIEATNNQGSILFGNDSIRFHAGSFDESAIIVLDTSGTIYFTRTVRTSAGQPDVIAVTMDHSGVAYLGLNSVGNNQLIFANDTLTNPVGPVEYNAILKWDLGGNEEWAYGIYPYSIGVSLRSMAVNSQNELLLCGSGGNLQLDDGSQFYGGVGNLFVLKLNSSKNLIFSQTVASPGSYGTYGGGIAASPADDYFISGNSGYSTSFQFECIGYTSPSPSNFVLKLTEQIPILLSASFTYVNNGFDYTFINQSTSADSWLWDFGDGTTSNLENPIHTFLTGGDHTVTLTAFSGLCSISDSITITGVGIDDLDKDIKLTLSPNPVQSNLKISFGANTNSFTATITDVHGRIVMPEFPIQNTSSLIDVSSLSKGIYFIHLSNDKNSVVRRFEKM